MAVLFAAGAVVGVPDAHAQQDDPCAVPNPPVPCLPHEQPDAGTVPEIDTGLDTPGGEDTDVGRGEREVDVDTEAEDCGTFDVACKVGRAIDAWFTDLVVGAMRPVMDLIGQTTLATPDVTGNAEIADLHRITRWVANSLFVLFVIAGGFVVASHETLQTRYALREILPRLLVAFLAVNVSLSLTGTAITGINAVTAAVLAGDGDVSAGMAAELTRQLERGGIFMILVALVVLVLALILLAIYVIRVALTIIVVVAAPLALVCHASPYSEGIAKLWWRALIAVLSIQLLQAITLLVFITVFFDQGTSAPTTSGLLGVSGGLMNLVVSAVVLFILIKIPVWVLRQVGLSGRSAIAGIVKYALIAKGMAAVGITRHGHAGQSGRGVPGRGGAAGSRPSGGGPRPTRAGGGARPTGGSRGGQGGGTNRSGARGGGSGPRGAARTSRPTAGGMTPQRASTGQGSPARRAREAATRGWSPPRGTGHTSSDTRTPPRRGSASRSPTLPTSTPRTGPTSPVPTRPAPPIEATPAGRGLPVTSSPGGPAPRARPSPGVQPAARQRQGNRVMPRTASEQRPRPATRSRERKRGGRDVQSS
ncbi:hypothetical protein [Haloechinothrix halophila]|uniref:hypothetical protein n=1 Tax=Haloechinothrix halophila TaxID=1069073 RepID=UPI0012F9A88A|nr:hypothetical protein [Haloechinothrix halophila]